MAAAAAPVKMSLFKPVYMDQRVPLTPTEYRDAAADIDTFLTGKIRKGLEGACCTHGYVRPGSTKIIARSMGQAEHGRFTGDFIYNCKVRVACLLPHANQLVTGRILMVNKLGAYALIVDEGRLREAMRILLPRDLHLGNQEFDALSAGQGVRIRLLRSRFQNNDAFIQAVGTWEGMAPEADAGAEATGAEKPEATGAEKPVEEEAVASAAGGGAVSPPT